MSRFDSGDTPLWTVVGDGYLALLAPLRVESEPVVADRPPYVKTLRQIGARPSRGDLEEQRFALTKSMPALAVHVREGRVENRTSQALDWRLDVDIHCFCGTLPSGSDIRQDQGSGSRALTQHVTEHLHMRLLPEPTDLDNEGIRIESIEHVITTPRVDWWVVRTSIDVRQEVARQRTSQVAGVEFRQLGKPGGETLAVHYLDFEAASAAVATTDHPADKENP